MKTFSIGGVIHRRNPNSEALYAQCWNDAGLCWETSRFLNAEIIGKQDRRISFNTGRHYAADGQHIEAFMVDWRVDEVLEEPRFLVKMWDHSRGLIYIYDLSDFNEERIMLAYDANSDISAAHLEDWGYTHLEMYEIKSKEA